MLEMVGRLGMVMHMGVVSRPPNCRISIDKTLLQLVNLLRG